MTEAALEILRRGDAVTALRMLESSGARDGDWQAAHGMVLLSTNRPSAAREAFKSAVKLGTRSPVVLLNLALAEEGAGDAGRAREIMRDLMERLPDWDEPALRLAESYRRTGDHGSAEGAYIATLERDPLRPEALIGRAVLRMRVGDGAGAQSLLLRCLGRFPERAEAWDALGLALMQTADYAAAESAFSEAQAREPGSLAYALHRVDAVVGAGTAELELARLEQASITKPLDGTLLAARGALLEKIGRRAEAVDALEAAVALMPGMTVPAVMLAGVLARTTRGADAVVALRHAMTLDPLNSRLANDLGAVLMRQHRHAEAERVLRELYSRHADDVICLCNLANATVLLGRQAEAVSLARRAVELAPRSVVSRRALVNAMPYHSAVDVAELLGELRALAEVLPREAPVFDNSADPARRLRLGLLSGSLRTHPVGWLTVAGFENLDPASFEIVCLAQNGSHDPMARRFRAIASEWHDIDTLDDAATAAFVRSLGIDIVIDLGGYGDAGRLTACARRLAPVQIKWVGMQNHSTGLAEMDWFITDHWETPEELRQYYSERPLYLPDGYVCYSSPPHAPDVTPLPALARGHVTFGCFNNLAKITPETIAVWSDILRRLPDARLVLKTHQFSDAAVRADVHGRFARHDVAEERIELRGASPHREFLRQYGDVDIVLDPFPYSGGLTTCEALWMGVPTVTLPGESFASRHSTSHMSNVGLRDWVARDRVDYVAVALAKAADIAALRELRAELRARVKASPLCDGPRFGHHLGIALRQAWQNWCQKTSPDLDS